MFSSGYRFFAAALFFSALSCTGAEVGRDRQGSSTQLQQYSVVVHGSAQVFTLDETRGALVASGSLNEGAQLDVLQTRPSLDGWLAVVGASSQQVVFASEGSLQVVSSQMRRPIGRASVRSSPLFDVSIDRRLSPIGASKAWNNVDLLSQNPRFSLIYVPETNRIAWVTSSALHSVTKSSLALGAVHIATVGTLTGSGVVSKKLIGGFRDLGIPSRLVLPTSPGEIGQQSLEDAAPSGVPVDGFVVDGGNPVWTTPLPGVRQRWGDLTEDQFSEFIARLFATARQSVLSVAQSLSAQGGGNIVTIVHHMGPNVTVAAMLYDDPSLHDALPANVRFTNVVIPIIHGTGALAFNPMSRDLHGGFNGEGWDRYRNFVKLGIPGRISVAIASTDAMAMQTSELFNLTPEKMVTVPLGAGEPFGPIPELHNIPENQFRRQEFLEDFNAQADAAGEDAGIENFKEGDRMLLFAGKLVTKKGPIELVHILAAIREQYPELNVHATIIGSGELRERIKDVAQELGVREFVHVLGPRDQVIINQFQNFADLFVMPYVWEEPFGLVPIEAALCGTPTVMPSDAGVASAVQVPWLFSIVDKVEGKIDIQSFVDAIGAALQADAKYSDVNGTPYWKAASDYILSDFSWDAYAKRVAAIAQNTVSQPN